MDGGKASSGLAFSLIPFFLFFFFFLLFASMLNRLLFFLRLPRHG